MDNSLLKMQADAGCEVSRSRQMTPRDRLEQKKRHLEAELTNVNAALDALTAHPDIEKVFELVGLAL